jgi:mannose-6-phosphate isomerase-like protein (cupin superfamily)
LKPWYVTFLVAQAAKQKPTHPGSLRPLPTIIQAPTRIQAAGNLPKLIDEYVGRVNTREARLSIAHMRSPAGWHEPAQTPEFEEYTIVLSGCLRLEYEQGIVEVAAGQAVITHPGEWVRYSTPDEATEYIAVCLPAFSPETVRRHERSTEDKDKTAVP